jgi:hypothetical protein
MHANISNVIVQYKCCFICCWLLGTSGTLTELTNSDHFTPKLENSFHFFAGARLLLAPDRSGYEAAITLNVLKTQLFFPLKTLIFVTEKPLPYHFCSSPESPDRLTSMAIRPCRPNFYRSLWSVSPFNLITFPETRHAHFKAAVRRPFDEIILLRDSPKRDDVDR